MLTGRLQGRDGQLEIVCIRVCHGEDESLGREKFKF